MTKLRVTLALVLCALLEAGTAGAESVKELAKKLLTHDDFRVRAQAALALGSSGEAEAMSPLCKGLDDSNDTVRAAAAGGLGKLQKGGLDCLKKRLDKEKVDNVQKMLKKAIRLIEEGAAGPAITDATRYYVAIGKTKGGGSRSDADAVVKRALRGSFGRKSEIALAPDGESDADAKKRLRKHAHVVGYLLVPDLSLSYGGGRLTVSLDVEILGYPDKSSLGSMSRTVAVQRDSEDEEEEDRLIEQVSRAIVDEFMQLAASVD
jgi:HEAT repeat protein